MEKVNVSAKALREVLSALNGPGHLIRELQVTRSSREPGKASLSDLTGVVNPIDELIEQFNTQITRNSLIGDLLSRDAPEYKMEIDLNGRFQFIEVFDQAKEGEVRLSEMQMGWVSGAHTGMSGTSTIVFCKKGKEPHYTLWLLEEDNTIGNDEDVEARLKKHDSIVIVRQIVKPVHKWTDLDLWKKFFDFFQIQYDFYDKGKIVHKVGDVQVGYGVTIDAGLHAKVDGYHGFHANIYFDVGGKFLEINIIEGFRTP